MRNDVPVSVQAQREIVDEAAVARVTESGRQLHRLLRVSPRFGAGLDPCR